jgi:uroporphyrin-3 C-methyltransferase
MPAMHPEDRPADAPESSTFPSTGRAWWPSLGLGMLAVMALGSGALAWQAQSRLNALEQELVRRQATSQGLAESAQGSAKQTEEQVRDLAAKLALAEAKLAEVALQRGQLEDLLSALSRSRDENVVGDLEASLRVASQQAALVGSTEPLLTALRQGDERLQRYKQPRLEGVRRALLRDLDRVKAASTVDAATLALRLDEVSRLIDDLPLLNEPQRIARSPVNRTAAPAAEPKDAWDRWRHWLGVRGDEVWDEVKSLVRVTRIEHPDAMLKTPEQSFFLRENLKLRLLNARLALLSRQFETARVDLEAALRLVQRHADVRQRRVQTAVELLTQVLLQAKPQPLPRPDDSLAALAALGAVR